MSAALALLASTNGAARAQSRAGFCATREEAFAALPQAVSMDHPFKPPRKGESIITRIAIQGARMLSANEVADSVGRTVLGHEGDPATIQRATKIVSDLYRRRGYPIAQVIDAEVDPEGVLRLTIAEGTIRRIVVRGNRRTREATILLALSLRPGDVYSETRARSDRARLAHLGIFDDVVIAAQAPGTEDTDVQPLDSVTSKDEKAGDIHLPPDLSQGSTPDNSASKDNLAENPSNSGTKGLDKQPGSSLNRPRNAAAPPIDPNQDEVGQVDLVVRVKEHQTFNVAATVGYADGIGPVGYLDLSELNVAGTAQRIDVEWQRISESYVNTDGTLAKQDSRQALDFLYEKPALSAKATSLSLSIYEKNTVFLPYFAGEDQTFRTFEKRNGATIRIGHAIRPGLTGYMTLRRADVGYDDVEDYYSGPQPSETLIASANARIAAVGAEIVSDGRDVVDNPRHGFLNSVRYEDANDFFGGNRMFSQTTADFRYYAPINAVKDGPVVAFRLLSGYSGGSTPLSEFYFLGGYEILRGYDLYSIYGDRMLVATGELRVRLTQGLQGVAFLEDGGAWLPGDGITSSQLNFDGGFGLRFLSPIGPIRFDAAYGSSLKTYVTLGQSF